MIRSMRIPLLIPILAVLIICFAQGDVTDSIAFADQAGIPLAINELMASNSNVIQDPQGQYDDWIEIHNYGIEAIDIGGMHLTDNLSTPTKWRIPGSNSALTTIPTGGYLLIWADNDTTDAGLHANFKLDADGEEIGLFDSDGITLIDRIVFGDQTPDISYGRYPDADDNQRFFSVPSPGAQNISAYLGEVAEAEFSHNRGFYVMPFYVTIATETENAVIYYTLDGSEPYHVTARGFSGGTVYTGPIPINKTTYLRTKAVKPGWKPGKINTQTFIFLDDVLQQSRSPSGFPSSWGGTSADYQMDPDVVQDPRYNGMMKDALLSIPSMSLVMTKSDLFDSGNGIYANPNGHGISWERPGSMELIYPDGTDGIQVNCGIRIHGGAFRNWGLTKKKSFRLLFKGVYGPTKLRYPLFGEDAVEQFDTVVLRAGANDGYSWNSARFTEQYTRDEFGRSLQRATGNVGSHGIFVHLYVNGLYWGLYNPCERPDASFSANYYGGDKEDWDSIHDLSASNGDTAVWNQMISKCRQAANSDEAYQELQGNNPDGTSNPAYPDLLDVTNYIDYLIVNLWGGNWDWPWKNWWAGRDRSANSTGFKFYCWDYENTMGNNLGRSPLNKNALQNNFSSAGVPHQNLSRNAEYRMLFADRVHRFFFNNGILTSQSLIDRYTAMANEIEMAIVTESSRWGDQHHHPPLTLEEWYDRDWNYNDGRAGRDWILNYYLPQRPEIVLQQFRSAGLYPNVDAPIFGINGVYQHGGLISEDDTLSMTAPMGTIWYTLDGSDPRMPDTTQQATVLVPENADKRAIVPTGNISENWKGGGAFDDSAWSSCTGSPGGVGFERTSGYQNLITLDLIEQMYARNATCYVRIPFTIDADYSSLTLGVRYDDGFVAYLNGVKVAERNFDGTPSWNSRAGSSHSDSAAVLLESIDISRYLDALQQGDNLLAIHGMNSSSTSSDFLISAELTASGGDSEDGDLEGAMEYAGPITLPHSVNVKARVLSGSTWSALNEAIYSVGPVAENLRITEIMYHPPRGEGVPPSDRGQDARATEEFIELTNIGHESIRDEGVPPSNRGQDARDTINLNLVSFTNGIDFTFPSIELAVGEHIVVVRNKDIFETRYGTDINIAGQYSGSLNNAGERIELNDAIGRTILDFRYEDGWRSITDGDGFSLTIIDAANRDLNSWDEKDSWRPSTYTGGSPGQDDGGILPNPGAVVFNEVLAHSHAGAPDWIELYCTGGSRTAPTTIDIGGWFLSDSNDNLFKYKIANGTTIGPNGYLVLYEDLNFGNTNDPGSYEPFALSENGERLYLSSAQNDVLTGYRNVEDFGASETGVSFGRTGGSRTAPTSSTDNYNFVAMEQNTPGSANSYPKVGLIVISEIMYNPDWPADGLYTNDQYEYIELHNISAEPVTLYRYDKGDPWKFTDGVEFTFPADVPVTIPAGGHLLVVKKPAAFSWRYPDVPAEIILGPYDGNLSNAGESLELGMPGDVDKENIRQYIRVDRVNYSDGSHPENCPGSIDLWPVEADGNGMSLKRKVLIDYGNDPDNWTASAPSPGEFTP